MRVSLSKVDLFFRVNARLEASHRYSSGSAVARRNHSFMSYKVALLKMVREMLGSIQSILIQWPSKPISFLLLS